MDYFRIFTDILGKAFYAITDIFPFGIFANIIGVDNAFNSGFAFYFFYILSIFFGAGFFFVFVKALNITVTTKIASGGGKEQKIKLFDLISRFILGRDTLPLFIYKFGFAFSRNTYVFIGFILLGLLFYVPADIGGKSISTVGGYRELYASKFDETQRAIIATFMGDSKSVLKNTETIMRAETVFDRTFVIRNECPTLTDIDASAACFKENQAYYDLFERMLAGITDISGRYKNSADYASFSNVVNKETEDALNAFKNTSLALDAVTAKKLTKSQLDAVMADKPFIAEVIGTGSTRGDVDFVMAGKRIAAKAIALRKEYIVKNSIKKVVDNATDYVSLEAKTKEMEATHQKNVNASKEYVLTSVESLKAVYEGHKVQGKSWVEAYTLTINTPSYASGSTDAQFSAMDKVAFTFSSIYGVIIILLAFLMSGWKSILLLFDFYYRSFVSKTRESFIQKMLIRKNTDEGSPGSEGSFNMYEEGNWGEDKINDTRSRIIAEDDKDASYFAKKLELQESIGDEVVVMNTMKGTYYILLVIEVFFKTRIVLYLIL